MVSTWLSTGSLGRSSPPKTYTWLPMTDPAWEERLSRSPEVTRLYAAEILDMILDETISSGMLDSSEYSRKKLRFIMSLR